MDSNIIINETPLEPDYKYWVHIYYDHLLNMYNIYILQNNKEIESAKNFNIFCSFIYKNSSKYISDYV